MKPSPRYQHRRPGSNSTFLLIFLMIFSFGFSSCGWIHNLFGPKYGCPTDGRNVGAERILSGEKAPKAGKFRGGD